MPPIFFDEVNKKNIMLITHSLIGFDLQQYFSALFTLKRAAIVMCLDSADADLRILKNYAMYGIKNYQCYIFQRLLHSQALMPTLRIAIIYFTEAIETVEKPYPLGIKAKLRAMVKERNPGVTDEEFRSNLIVRHQYHFSARSAHRSDDSGIRYVFQGKNPRQLPI